MDINVLIIEMQGVESDELAVPVNNTLVHHMYTVFLTVCLNVRILT